MIEDYDEASGIISKDQHCEGKESQRRPRKAKARSRIKQETSHCRRDNRLRHLILITGSWASRCLFDCREIRRRLEWGTETRIESRQSFSNKMMISNFGQEPPSSIHQRGSSNTERKGNSLREAEALKSQAAATKEGGLRLAPCLTRQHPHVISTTGDMTDIVIISSAWRRSAHNDQCYYAASQRSQL